MSDQLEAITLHAPSPTNSNRQPATGEPGRSYPVTHRRRRAAAAAAHAAFEAWRRTAFAERAAMMREAAAVLRRRKDEFAALMTDEMGKTVTDGRAEVDKCASACEHFAEHAAGYLAREPVDIDGAEAFVTFNPLGVVLAVMPWNFPFWQVFRFAAPALMAGNGARAQARQQRAGLRAGDRVGVPRGRLPRATCSRTAADAEQRGQGADRGRPMSPPSR